MQRPGNVKVEKELASQRVKEAEVLLNILREDENRSTNKFAEANAQIQTITHPSSKSRVLPKEVVKNTTSPSSDPEDSEEEDEEITSEPGHPLTEAALQALSTPSPLALPSKNTVLKFLPLTYTMASNVPERRSTRQRDPNALMQRQVALSELISQPGQTGRRLPVPAPTQGERGQALAVQQRQAKRGHGTAPTRSNNSTRQAAAPVPSAAVQIPSVAVQVPSVTVQVPSAAAQVPSTVASAPFMLLERPDDQPTMSQHMFNYGIPLATDTAGIESDHEDGGSNDNDNFGHENDPGDDDGDATLRAPPNLEMLQNLGMIKFSDHVPLDPFGASGWPSGSGSDTESMLDLLNAPGDSRYNFQRSFSTPHQAILAQQPVPGSEPEPNWVFDPLPPNSTMSTSNPQGAVVDTLQRHQEKRGRARMPDPATLALYSRPTASNLPPAGRQVARSSSRASVVASERSSTTSMSSDWTFASMTSQPVGPQRTVYLRRRSKQSELPPGHPSLPPADRVVVRAAQNLLIEKLLVEDAFPDSSILKQWARGAYQQAHFQAAQTPAGVGSAPPIPTELAIKSIKAVASVIRNQLKRLCEERVPWLYDLNPPEYLRDEEKRAYIRERVKTLLDKGHYTHSDTHGRSKFFNHKALFNIARTYFYDSHKGLAQGHDTLFGPLFPINCIALVFTAVRSTIRSYRNGAFLSLEFSRKNSDSTFRHILRQLNDMQTNHLSEVLRSIRTRLFESRLETGAMSDDLSGEEDYFDDDAFLSDNDYYDNRADNWPGN
ncbi:hypothetical protein DXG01_011614 [Tephrocybe rancida]|nr:hypothetical protein DXG01_011614 [Tephrocybe rancida]